MTTSPPVEPEERTDRRRLRRSVLILSISLVSVGVALVSALYTFTDPVPGSTFSTGSVHLDATPNSAVFTAPDMSPGDIVNGNINVLNDGSMELRYAITGITTASTLNGVADDPVANTLASELDLTIRTGIVPGDCTGTAAVAGGTVIYGPGPTSGVVEVDLVGSDTTGADDPNGGALPGPDRVLAEDADEDLCFTVTLPDTGDNTAVGTGVTVTWNFEAEQTANNP